MSIEENNLNNSPEELVNEKIANASTLDDLYEEIKAMGEIEGTHRKYPAIEIIGIIEDVRKGNLRPSYITRSYGIRDAAIRLLREKN
jgi:hypothetical protein